MLTTPSTYVLCIVHKLLRIMPDFLLCGFSEMSGQSGRPTMNMNITQHASGKIYYAMADFAEK